MSATANINPRLLNYPPRRHFCPVVSLNIDWNARFNALVNFLADHDHLNVPPYHCRLYHWMYDQSQLYFKYLEEGDTSIISRERFNKLISIGIGCLHRKNSFGGEAKFLQVREYKRQHGDCNIQDSLSLRSWASRQKRNYKKYFLQGKKSELDEDRVALLHSKGFFDS